jgi:hypothetical protein
VGWRAAPIAQPSQFRERAMRLALDLGREARGRMPGDELGEDARDRRRGRVGRDCGVAGHRRAPSR